MAEGEEVSEGTTFLRTCINGLNALAGVGLITIPYALSKGGWLSLLLFVILSIICCYTGILLQRCMDAHPGIKTYPDIGVLAFGKFGQTAVSLFMYFELYLVAIEFLILEGDNLNHLFPKFGFNLLGIKFGGKHGFIILAALVVLPTTWLRSLGVLAYVSAGGVLASFVVVACVLWAGAVDGIGFHEGGTVVDWGGMSTALSVYAFCFCGHAVFPTLCSMKNKKRFTQVLIVCFAISTFTYGALAVLGYLMFGDGVASQVTLDLPKGKLNSKLAIYTTLISPFTKSSLKSPWSRRRRKHPLSSRQWKRPSDGKLRDGVKFLKKVRSGGVDPTIRADVWAFLLGVNMKICADSAGKVDPTPTHIKVDPTSQGGSNTYTAEDFATWQRIIRKDAVRADADWVIYSPTQATVSEGRARRSIEAVRLKEYDQS